MIQLFIRLILAHLVGDFLLQSEKWVQHKNKNKHKSRYLYYHIGIHAIFLMLTLEFNPRYWIAFVIIITSHFFIDLAKLHLQNKKNQRWLFMIDQLSHILVIALVVQIYEPYLSGFSEINWTMILLILACTIGVTSMSAIVMKVIISKWNIKKINKDEDSLENAGTYIGILERLLVFLFVVTDLWSGIGFLLAAKSIFRFGDLSRAKDRKLTEYVLIGTLLSFGFAIGIGMLFKQVMKLI